MTEPKFEEIQPGVFVPINDPNTYGTELRLKTELKQTVETEDGSSVVSYKAFIKKNDKGENEVKIYPVNEQGKVEAGSKPIFNNGVWDETQITKPKYEYKSRNRTEKKLNVTFDGLDVITTTTEEKSRTIKEFELTGGGFADAEYIEANTVDGVFTGNPVMPPYILNGEEITYERFMEIKQEQLDGVNVLDKYGVEKTTVIPATSTTVVEGVLFDELQTVVQDYSLVTSEDVPSWAANKELSRVDEIENELKKLRAEGYEKSGNQQVDQRRSRQWTEQIKDLEKELAIEKAKVEFNSQTNGTDNDMGGASGVTERLKYDFDRDDEVTFQIPVKYPRDLSMMQDHLKIQCYTYEPPYTKEFTKTNENTDGGGGDAFGAQRGTAFRKKVGAPIILPMPNNIQGTDARQWEESNMNNQALNAIRRAGSNTIFKSILSDVGLGQITPVLDNISSLFQTTSQRSGRADFAANKMSQLLADANMDVSSDQILARTAGVIANSNTELLFGGVSLRSFEFQWLLSPRDPKEAHNVRMMIRAFKEWSAPRKVTKLASGPQEAGNTGLAGGPSYFLGTPNVFSLKYQTDGNKPIRGMPLFKACALTEVNINYTPEGQWMAYEGGQPTSYTMTLKFNELEPIYNTDYGKKIADPDRMRGDTADLEEVFVVDQADPNTSFIGY